MQATVVMCKVQGKPMCCLTSTFYLLLIAIISCEALVMPQIKAISLDEIYDKGMDGAWPQIINVIFYDSRTWITIMQARVVMCKVQGQAHVLSHINILLGTHCYNLM